STSSGDIVLIQSNKVGTFAASDSAAGANISFVGANSSGLTIGSVATSGSFAGASGVTSTGGAAAHTGNISLTASGGTLTIANAISSTPNTGGTLTIGSGV